MIGLERGVVKLVPYSAEWGRFFELEKTSLLAGLRSYVLDIQHVGSTSIPGMLAKPIVDIAIAVADFDEARVCVPLIEGLGYEYRGELGITFTKVTHASSTSTCSKRTAWNGKITCYFEIIYASTHKRQRNMLS
jgi:GrpB-like predicted nucleotidyltransferase (UPF0157 family)